MNALRILVVEDDAMIGMMLAEMLEEMGHDVCSIEATEADAVSAADRCRPDLMIVDVLLGDGNGVSAVARILRTRLVPYLFVSADISKLKTLKPSQPSDSTRTRRPGRVNSLRWRIQRTRSNGRRRRILSE
jgi:two-component system, response regulator PdtaR